MPAAAPQLAPRLEAAYTLRRSDAKKCVCTGMGDDARGAGTVTATIERAEGTHRAAHAARKRAVSHSDGTVTDCSRLAEQVSVNTCFCEGGSNRIKPEAEYRSSRKGRGDSPPTRSADPRPSHTHSRSDAMISCLDVCANICFYIQRYGVCF